MIMGLFALWIAAYFIWQLFLNVVEWFTEDFLPAALSFLGAVAIILAVIGGTILLLWLLWKARPWVVTTLKRWYAACKEWHEEEEKKGERERHEACLRKRRRIWEKKYGMKKTVRDIEDTINSCDDMIRKFDCDIDLRQRTRIEFEAIEIRYEDLPDSGLNTNEDVIRLDEGIAKNRQSIEECRRLKRDFEFRKTLVEMKYQEHMNGGNAHQFAKDTRKLVDEGKEKLTEIDGKLDELSIDDGSLDINEIPKSWHLRPNRDDLLGETG